MMIEKRAAPRPAQPGQSAELETYYLHVHKGGDVFPDDDGRSLTKEDAVALGGRVAQELAQEGDWEGYSVAVIDANGCEIASFTVARNIN